MNVKLNDNVLVITGKDAGKQGRVIATSPKHGKVVVEGVNIQKKAKKARKANEQSQIIEQPPAKRAPRRQKPRKLPKSVPASAPQRRRRTPKARPNKEDCIDYGKERIRKQGGSAVC